MAISMPATGVAVEQLLFVGTQQPEKGIYGVTLDSETGELSAAQVVGDAPRPGFLALHPTLPLLYSITKEAHDPSGGVRSFTKNPNSPSLEPLNIQRTDDEGATHLSVNPASNLLAVAHYAGGSTVLFPLKPDGSIGECTAREKHEGSSVHPDRQTKPYAHGVASDPSGNFLLVADLGTDEVLVYRITSENHLARHSVWQATPGSGPRHLAFHPNGKWVYCIHELNGTMSALSFDKQEGTLTELQTLATLPVDFTDENTTAEVVVHPSGKFVYGSNRGHDTTAVFSVDAQSGKLKLQQLEPTRGEHPRFIGIDLTGKFLISANRDSNNLVSFFIDQSTGRLTPTGFETSVPLPVCVVFTSAANE